MQNKPMKGSNKQKKLHDFNFFSSLIGYSAIATIISHPGRVFLNCASETQSPLETIRNSTSCYSKGISYNFFRGTSVISAQTSAKEIIPGPLGIIGAVFMGAGGATVLETPFLRDSMAEKFKIDNYSVWRYNFPLSTKYAIREGGFCIYVFGGKEFSPIIQYSALISSAYVTAAAHKFATLEAIRDFLPPEDTIPDFRKGIFSTCRAMAQGNVYKHPAFQVPFENPISSWAKTANFMHVSCGINMYLFRLFYLILAERSIYYAPHVTSAAKNILVKLSLFNQDKQAVSSKSCDHNERCDGLRPPPPPDF